VEDSETPQLPDKKRYLTARIKIMEDKYYGKALDLLEAGRALIDRENPEEVDFQLLEKVHEAYRITGKHGEAQDVLHQEQELKDIRQSRDFLLLAETYQENSWDSRWALQIVTEPKTESQYRREAEQQLSRLVMAS
jgi:hypothetical protein